MNINDRLDRIEAKLKPESTDALFGGSVSSALVALIALSTTSGMESRNGPDLMVRPRRRSS